MSSNGWSEWSRHVLSELERLNTVIERVDDRQDELHTSQETARVEFENCRSKCGDDVLNLKSDQKECAKRFQALIVEQTKQDREDRRANRRITATLIVCVVSALAAITAAVINTVNKS